MENVEAKVLEIVGRHKPGDTLPIEEVDVIIEYCKSVRAEKDDCSKCILHKKYDKCPIALKIRPL